jgi:DNA-binding PadR family transcriptional regulator
MQLEIKAKVKSIKISEQEILIIDYLLKNGECHPYKIAGEIAKKDFNKSIYIYINRLEKKGVVESKRQTRVRNGTPMIVRLIKLTKNFKESYTDI